ncbi:GGDEF domain-containing protein [Shewanella woodyi]|uniref:Diguanylate cyclase with PAS/PAC sensor n=1 Tax=Shewanella woodyi (strain ATCC 51908 / MS32) TaxID=392500 RepID=B1KH63_SHEWM|nr:GGDEF domain-containing protein [Shewanella woodyi]ACA88375.1 diguanylate cyclase with PAS/PAC sensor [Shewanella woodyi ATCC 51908]
MRRFSRKLYFKVAAAIAVGAAIIAALSSFAFYFGEVARIQERARADIHQLVKTVEKTATIAVYVQDQELAKEILTGLAMNDLVAAVELVSVAGFSLDSGSGSLLNLDHVEQIKLFHPFNEAEQIGELRLLADEVYINYNAKGSAVNQAQMLALLTVTTALLVSLIVHQTLTSPLNEITDKFEEVEPGKDIEIKVPRFHHGDEIGSLAKGINRLISSLNSSIESERDMREKTEVLEKKFRLIFEQASAGICLIDGNNLLVTANPAFQSILLKTHSISDAIGLKLTDWFHNQEQLEAFLLKIRHDNNLDTVALDLKLKTQADSRDCWVHCLFSKVMDCDKESGLIIEVLMYDVTERTEREVSTRFEADHDALTHLKNRRAGERLLRSLFNRASENSEMAVILNIDLDKFKAVNDIHGHEAGDSVLVEVGKRLMSVFRNDDICIRWGGDEFVVGCYFDTSRLEDRGEAAIASLGEKLVMTMSQNFSLSDDVTIEMGASVGISVYPQHGRDLERLLTVADLAMYQSKQAGRNQYSIYQPELSAQNLS